MKKILYITNISKRDGMGNYSRIIKLYKSNKSIPKKKIFLLSDNYQINIKNKNFKAFNYNDNKMSYDLERRINNYNPSVIIIDLNKKYMNKYLKKIILSKKYKIIVIDYFDEKLKDFVNIHWIPSVSFKNKSKNIFSGWDTIILNKLNNYKNKNKKINNIAIFSGASDTYKIGFSLPLLIDEKFKDHKINFKWIQGPFAKKPILPKNTNNSWEIIQDPKSIDPILNKTKLAISIFGVTAFEIFNHNIPSVIIFPKRTKYDIDYKFFKKNKFCISVRTIKQIPKSLLQLNDNIYLCKQIKNNLNKININSGIKNFNKRCLALI